jgi:hypothetical protein
MCQKREREREREKDMLKWCVITHHPKEDHLKMGVSNSSSKIEMVCGNGGSHWTIIIVKLFCHSTST